MSKNKRNKTPLLCPECKQSLFVKASRFKTAHHPLYLKKGTLIIDYSHSVQTDDRQAMYWIYCLNYECPFKSKGFDKEQDLRNEIGSMFWTQTQERLIGPVENKNKHHNEETLPVLIQPSQMNLEECFTEESV